MKPGATVIDDPGELECYAYDASFEAMMAPRRPDVVVQPRDADDVSRVLRFASEQRVPVTPRGGAWSRRYLRERVLGLQFRTISPASASSTSLAHRTVSDPSSKVWRSRAPRPFGAMARRRHSHVAPPRQEYSAGKRRGS